MEKLITLIAFVFVLLLNTDKLVLVTAQTYDYDTDLGLNEELHPLSFMVASGGDNGDRGPPFQTSSNNGLLSIEKMIRKGTEASESMFPYMASLQVLWTDNRMYHICGGVLFATNKVLTAAHCMVYWGQFDLYVALGVQFISRGGEALIRVENATVHPEFNATVKEYPWDIAVLTLETDAVISPKVQLGVLATYNDSQFENMEECEIMGWGSTEEEDRPDGLHFAILKGISNNDCRRFLRVFKFRGLEQYHKCAWGWPHAFCQGDSGGPLVCQGLIIGISSWGIAGCNGCFPSIYSRVAYHYDWIVAQ